MNLLEKSPKIKVYRRLRAVFFALWAGAAASACAGAAGQAPVLPSAPPALTPEEAVSRLGLTGAEMGFLVVEADSGRTVAKRAPEAPVIPASTAKVLTAWAALSMLGPEHRFGTRVAAQGSLADGVLDGDLSLIGGGDPMLGMDGLLDLVLAVKAAGLRRVAGRFLFDETALPALDRIAPGQPDAAGYNPGVSALDVDFNRTRLTWRPGPEGGTEAFLGPDPSAAAIRWAGNAPDGVAAVREGEAWGLSPKVGADGEAWLPVRAPGERTARLFAALARMNGIDLPAPQAGRTPTEARPLARHESLPLREVVRAGLEFSNNLVAEALGLAVARRLSGERPESLSESADLLAGWLRERVPNVSWDGLVLPNHSGLSPAARVTPAQMVAALRRALAGDPGFQALLPAAGIRDAFGGRFREPDATLRVWAKTGTLNYASGLVGVLHARSGRTLVFALYVTDFSRRRAFDALDNPEDPGAVAAADSWRRRAKALEADLVRGWVDHL